MRVLLQPEVFTPEHQIELLVLAWLGNAERHRIAPAEHAIPAHDAWVETLDPDTRQYWKDMLNASTQREQFAPAYWEIAVTTGRDAAWSHATPIIPIVEALDLLMQPYRIVVENNVHDKHFLLASCGCNAANELKKWEKRGWLVFEMGGGTTIVPRVDAIRTSEALRRQASVLVDSDARRPPDKNKHETMEHVEGDVASKVRRAAGNAVHWKSLNRRSIENYLPVVVLRRHWNHGKDTREQVLRAFDRLTQPQKHHYNMKAGLKGDASKENEVKAGGLYMTLDPPTKGLLEQGFGGHIADLFRYAVRVEDLDPDARLELNTFVTEVLERMR